MKSLLLTVNSVTLPKKIFSTKIKIPTNKQTNNQTTPQNIETGELNIKGKGLLKTLH